MKAFRIVGLLVVLSLLLSLVPTAPVAMANPPAPQVLPANGSYKDLSSKWWQWVLSYPAATNPLFQSGCSIGRSGNQLFLVGGLYTGEHDFTCTVPGGKQLFLPVANFVWVSYPWVPEDTVQAATAGVKSAIDGVYDLRAEVDGVPVQNIESYRLPSPSIFAVRLPSGNIFDVPPGMYPQSASDGYYLLLAPLSAGEHTIYVHGVFAGASFTVDATFHLTVTE